MASPTWTYCSIALLCCLGVRLAHTADADQTTDPHATSSEVHEKTDHSETFRPPKDPDSIKDWVRLSSNEWLRGKIRSLRDDRLKFKSDKAGEHDFKMKDVREVIPGRPVHIYLTDRTRYHGPASIQPNAVALGDPPHRTTPRNHLIAMVVDQPTELDRWTGRFSWGLALKSGNTNRSDLTWSLTATRRTLQTRLNVEYDGQIGENSGTRDLQRQNALARFDFYLGRVFYITKPQIELFHDKFQNIALRATPSVSTGYALYKNVDNEWLLDAGIGYRFTEYESVGTNNDATETDAVLLLGTSLSWDLTDRLEIEGSHRIQRIIQHHAGLDQHTRVAFIIEIWKDFKVDLAFTWDHIANPKENADGVTPAANDYILSTGIGYKL